MRWVSVSALTITLMVVSGSLCWADRHYDYSQIDRLVNLNNRVNWLLQQGKYQEALKPAEEALRLAKRIYADEPEHDNIEVSMHTLAAVYMNLGRYSDAEPLYKRILEIDEELLGPNDLEVSRSLVDLANVYQAQGRQEEAERLLKRAQNIREGFPAPGYPGAPRSQRTQAEAGPPEKVIAASKRQREVAKALPLRTITVCVAADEEFRRRDDWENAIQASIKSVSEVFDKNFHIQFKIVDIVPWSSNNRAADFKAMIIELRAEVQCGDAEIVLGFSGQQPRTFGEEEWGIAFPLTSTALVLFVEELEGLEYSVDSSELQHLIITHEICHLFGAWHVKNHRSIMYKRFTTADLTFDEQTAKTINLMRGFNFKKGVNGIVEETKRKLSTIFKEGHAAGEDNPLSDAYNNEGAGLVEQGKYDEAIAALNKAFSFNPSRAEVRRNLITAYGNQGAKLIDQGKYREAIAALREVLRIDPNDADAHHNLTVAYINQANALGKSGKYNEAIAAYREALSVAPHDADARHNLIATYINQGIALGKRGKYKGALAAFQEALRIAPNDIVVRRNLIACYSNQGAKLYGQGKYSEAIAEFHKALRVDPNDADVRHNLISAYSNRGTALAEEGKYSEAIAAYREALRVDPNDASVRHNLIAAYGNQGNALAKEGKYNEAIAAYREALRIGPNQADLRRNLTSAFNNLIINLTDGEKYSEAWNEVHRAQNFGVKVDLRTLEFLKEKMPEPSRHEALEE